jgi:hypothetical protein
MAIPPWVMGSATTVIGIVLTYLLTREQAKRTFEREKKKLQLQWEYEQEQQTRANILKGVTDPDTLARYRLGAIAAAETLEQKCPEIKRMGEKGGPGLKTRTAEEWLCGLYRGLQGYAKELSCYIDRIPQAEDSNTD